MQCQNCGCNLEDEYRYCPRCGAPGSLGWPAAGAPWLRRPAAVVGLALLLVAWLVALQRQLWVTARPGPGSPLPSTVRIAGLPPRGQIGSAQRREPGHAASAARSGHHRPPGTRTEGSAEPDAAATGGPAPRYARRPAVTLRSRKDASPPAGEQRPGDAGAVAHRGASPALFSAAAPVPERRHAASPDARDHGASRRRPGHAPQAGRPRSQPPVFVRSPQREPVEPAVWPSELTVSIAARPYRVKTYVYLDGGRELGIAPLRVRFDRPGRHHLLFFAPALGRGGRLSRNIAVTGQSPQRVSVSMAPSREFARTAWP